MRPASPAATVARSRLAVAWVPIVVLASGAAVFGLRPDLAGAVAGQAAVFGFAHLGADVTGPAPLLWLGMTASGVVAGLVAVRSRSRLLPFTVHAALDIPLFYAAACRVAT